MSKIKELKEEPYSLKKAASYSIGQIINNASYQTFSLLVFTFYFTIVGLNVILITIAFMIWSVWNSINDPLLGSLSDKTHTKWGRRYPYIMISIVPLAIVMFLLFTPPVSLGIKDQIPNFIYFLIIIMVFEFFYSMFDVNLIALFPELFITEEERTSANAVRMTVYLITLIITFGLPTIFIPDFSNPKYLTQYHIFGIFIAALIILAGVCFLKFSPKEKAEFRDEYKNIQSFKETFKICVKNKTFMRYLPAEMGMWYVIGVTTTIIVLYGKFVLGIGEGETIYIALMLAIGFISTAIFMNVLWKPVVRKIGTRKSWMISVFIWILVISPFMFIQDRFQGIIVLFFFGIGLSGPIYIIDLILSDIIDEDEVNTGTRREAGYYGVKAFFYKLSTVFVFLTIGLVFTNIGWAVYEPEKVTSEVIFGLRALMFIFPAIALVISLLVMYIYPLHGEKLAIVKQKLQKIHEEKRSRL
ncbi:MAG: MFS transporter [Promethearchaeota archaeon]|nr:MAG: MFS transporter [Candidatus Lokiarchaeota archaeon]